MPTPLSPSLALLPARERPVPGSGQERGHPWSRASSCGLGKARVWPWAPRPGVPGSCLEHPSVCSGAAVPTPQLFWGLGGAPALHSSRGTGPPGMPTRPGEPQPGRSTHLRPLGGLRGSSLPCLSVLLSGAWGADSRGEWGPRRPGLGGRVGRGQEAVLESSVFWGTVPPGHSQGQACAPDHWPQPGEAGGRPASLAALGHCRRKGLETDGQGN